MFYNFNEMKVHEIDLKFVEVKLIGYAWKLNENNKENVILTGIGWHVHEETTLGNRWQHLIDSNHSLKVPYSHCLSWRALFSSNTPEKFCFALIW
jgi:hypothetical protein